ncbi:GAS2-like protein 2 [Arapaima gigas]
MSGIEGATSQSIKPFRSSHEYLFAMKEDLAEWLRELHGVSVWGHSFLEVLETGSLLCHHANEVTKAACHFLREHGAAKGPCVQLPARGVTFNSAAPRASFAARDNVSNFIGWCRRELGIADVLMFETDDLVLRKNEKNFVLCLLEVARRASRFGMVAPTLIQMEDEIEQEIHEDLHMPPGETLMPRAQHRVSDLKNLDEMVQHLVSRCTCPTQFPMVKVSEGKYRVGDSTTVIFVRILRNHVMVRVGGGWDTLEHYLDKHDPCRCTSLSHKSFRALSLQRPATPVHGVKACLGQKGAQTTLLVSRLQLPPKPVCWSPSATPEIARTGSARALLRHSSPSLDPSSRVSRELRPPTPIRQRSVTPSGRKTPSDSREGSIQSVTMRTSREATQQGSSPHLANSLTQLSEFPCTSQPEAKHPKTPLMFQKNPFQPSLHAQHSLYAHLEQTSSNSQLVSRVKQSNAENTVTGDGASCSASMQRLGGLFSARPSTPVCCNIPIQNIHYSSCTATKAIQPIDAHVSSSQSSNFICPDSPTRHMKSENLDTQQLHHSTVANRNPKDHLVDQKTQWMPLPYNSQETPKNIFKEMKKGAPSSSTQGALSRAEDIDIDRAEDRRHVFTPQPISPAQEAILYRSLEHEILTNLQLLDTDSEDSSSEEDPRDGGREEGVRAVSRCFLLPQSLDTPLPSSEYTAQTGASANSVSSENGYDAVVAEFRKRKNVLRNVDMKSWVAKLPSKSGDTIHRQEAQVNTGHVKGAKQSIASSWSSLTSSMKPDEGQDPKEAQNDECGTDAVRSRLQALAASTSSTATVQGSSKQSNLSFKQNRLLKKPERVPSIYKLKLRPRIRPRQDHRPEKKPSKIPTPVFYRRCQLGRNSQRERRQQTLVPPSPFFEDLDSQEELEPSQSTK